MSDKQDAALVEVLLLAIAFQAPGGRLRPEVLQLLVDSPVRSLLAHLGHLIHYGADEAAKLAEIYEQLLEGLRSGRGPGDSEFSPGDLVEVRTGRYASSQVQVRVVWVGEQMVDVAPRDLSDDYVLSTVPLADVSRESGAPVIIK